MSISPLAALYVASTLKTPLGGLSPKAMLVAIMSPTLKRDVGHGLPSLASVRSLQAVEAPANVLTSSKYLQATIKAHSQHLNLSVFLSGHTSKRRY